MPELHCIVVTPEATVRDQQADFVVLPLFDGEIGIAPGHSPMIGRLGAGEMRIVANGQTSRFYLEGGFLQVVENTVTVLTGRAVPAEDIELEKSEGLLAAAQAQKAHSPEDLALRQRKVDQARAQIRVARRAAAQ